MDAETRPVYMLSRRNTVWILSRIDGETMETVREFILVASKSLQMMTSVIKRHLLLGRKAMTILDSILKSNDITLSTKVCLVKAMVFPVVMYGSESWTIKKAES